MSKTPESKPICTWKWIREHTRTFNRCLSHLYRCWRLRWRQQQLQYQRPSLTRLGAAWAESEGCAQRRSLPLRALEGGAKGGDHGRRRGDDLRGGNRARLRKQAVRWLGTSLGMSLFREWMGGWEIWCCSCRSPTTNMKNLNSDI